MQSTLTGRGRDSSSHFMWLQLYGDFWGVRGPAEPARPLGCGARGRCYLRSTPIPRPAASPPQEWPARSPSERATTAHVTHCSFATRAPKPRSVPERAIPGPLPSPQHYSADGTSPQFPKHLVPTEAARLGPSRAHPRNGTPSVGSCMRTRALAPELRRARRRKRWLKTATCRHFPIKPLQRVEGLRPERPEPAANGNSLTCRSRPW